MKRTVSAVVIACAMSGGILLHSVATHARAPQLPFYDSFYAFGDSLGDIGNVFLLTQLLGVDPAVPPSVSPYAAYFAGRFTNGPVAFEYLWESLSGQPPGSAGGLIPSLAVSQLPAIGAVNFAFGGTGTGVLDPLPGGLLSAPGLVGQVELFRAALNGAAPSPNALYAIVAGANDYLNPLSQQQSPEEVVGNIVQAVRSLYALGARDIIVVSLPDLGQLPFSGSAAGALSDLTKTHNKLLKKSLHQAAARLKGLVLTEVDANEVLAKLPEGMNRHLPALDAFFPPEIFPAGFRMSLCLVIASATCADVPTFFLPAPGYLYWDSLHPTTTVHELLALKMLDELKR